MPLTLDIDRGRKAAEALVRAFATTGIHGRKDMPEDVLPAGVVKGSLEHLLFLTLTVSIDYQRYADALWKSSRRTYEDPRTRYLFDPGALSASAPDVVARDMQQHSLAKKPRKDPWIWRTIGVTFHKKWGGDPRRFLADCGWSAQEVLERLRDDRHLSGARQVPDYPYLRGPKIGTVWVRILRDNAGMTDLVDLEKVPIPVDVHIARATLRLGVVRGNYSGSLSGLFEHIRQAWSSSVRGLSCGDRAMVALDVDEPLWHLSKYGCATWHGVTGKCLQSSTCEVRGLCVDGIVRIGRSKAEVST